MGKQPGGKRDVSWPLSYLLRALRPVGARIAILMDLISELVRSQQSFVLFYIINYEDHRRRRRSQWLAK